MGKFYSTLGESKCQELIQKAESLWSFLDLSNTRKSSQVYGRVLEGIAKDFIREFLPTQFKIKSGLVFDNERNTMSPEIDGIIYEGAPLLDFTDVAVVQKKQVRAIVEVKSYINITNLFGELKSDESRDPNTYLADDFNRRKGFVPSGAKYVLFAYELQLELDNTQVIKRLNSVCDNYAIVLRYKPKIDRETGKENWYYNLNDSVSWFIKWLRNMS